MSARCPRGGIWTLTEGDGFLSTVYEPTTRGTGWSLTRMLAGGDVPLPDVA